MPEKIDNIVSVSFVTIIKKARPRFCGRACRAFNYNRLFYAPNFSSAAIFRLVQNTSMAAVSSSSGG